MASYKKRQAKGGDVFHLFFVFDRKQYRRSPGITEERRAAALCGVIEDTIHDLKLGKLRVPEGVDPGDFIVSGGKLVAVDKKAEAAAWTLDALLERYRADLPAGAKAASSLETEEMHGRHLRRGLGADRKLADIDTAAIQRYVTARSREKYRGRLVGPDTIAKEIDTLRVVWNWAANRKIIDGAFPVRRRDLDFPRSAEKPPFRTLAEIGAMIGRGNIKPDEEGRLWECLYLDRGQVAEVIEFVRTHACAPFLHPMLAAVAFTGIRRSEAVRSRVEDWDLDRKVVMIREKKRVHSRSESFRSVPLHSALIPILREWFATHPGGQFAFCRGREPITADVATYHLRHALNQGPWKVVRGYHTLRHSFASNLACLNVDQRLIDKWMGHSTEVRKRYQHLFPDVQAQAIEGLLA